LSGRVEKANKEVLIQCRQQLGLELDIVARKVKRIADYESGLSKPTFKQLDTLAEIYNVPRWVFIADTLPEQYELSKSMAAFRQFSESKMDSFNDPKVRSLIKKVEEFRNLILDLREDMGEPIEDFLGPRINSKENAEEISEEVLKWLGAEGHFNFSDWKTLFERKDIFVFMTSKYNGWSHIDREVFRGLTLYHEKLPIIIVNDSDAKKAQSFSLFHELGHILRKENAIDDWQYHGVEVENWCDNLAGNCLLPKKELLGQEIDTNSLNSIKNIAKKFIISPYACIVRLSQLGVISGGQYKHLEDQLIDEFARMQKKLRESDGGPARNRTKEIISQYGHLYTTTLLQAFNNQELGLHKVSKLFDLKNHDTVFEIQRML
jgi:Zn-dependent peptidase ImmA (M78 family)